MNNIGDQALKREMLKEITSTIAHIKKAARFVYPDKTVEIVVDSHIRFVALNSNTRLTTSSTLCIRASLVQRDGAHIPIDGPWLLTATAKDRLAATLNLAREIDKEVNRVGAGATSPSGNEASPSSIPPCSVPSSAAASTGQAGPGASYPMSVTTTDPSFLGLGQAEPSSIPTNAIPLDPSLSDHGLGMSTSMDATASSSLFQPGLPSWVPMSTTTSFPSQFGPGQATPSLSPTDATTSSSLFGPGPPPSAPMDALTIDPSMFLQGPGIPNSTWMDAETPQFGPGPPPFGPMGTMNTGPTFFESLQAGPYYAPANMTTSASPFRPRPPSPPSSIPMSATTSSSSMFGSGPGAPSSRQSRPTPGRTRQTRPRQARPKGSLREPSTSSPASDDVEML